MMIYIAFKCSTISINTVKRNITASNQFIDNHRLTYKSDVSFFLFSLSLSFRLNGIYQIEYNPFEIMQERLHDVPVGIATALCNYGDEFQITLKKRLNKKLRMFNYLQGLIIGLPCVLIVVESVASFLLV